MKEVDEDSLKRWEALYELFNIFYEIYEKEEAKK